MINFSLITLGKGKKSLLSKFGSAKAVSKASRLDLKSVDGISEELAKVVFNHFRESN